MEHKPNRLYKSRLFVMIFADRRNLLELYGAAEKEHRLELKVLMLNINIGHNPELMKASRTLWEYAEYTGRVRKYAKEFPVADAVEQAITECIQEGILKNFLEKNRT